MLSGLEGAIFAQPWNQRSHWMRNRDNRTLAYLHIANGSEEPSELDNPTQGLEVLIPATWISCWLSDPPLPTSPNSRRDRELDRSSRATTSCTWGYLKGGRNLSRLGSGWDPGMGGFFSSYKSSQLELLKLPGETGIIAECISISISSFSCTVHSQQPIFRSLLPLTVELEPNLCGL